MMVEWIFSVLVVSVFCAGFGEGVTCDVSMRVLRVTCYVLRALFPDLAMLT